MAINPEYNKTYDCASGNGRGVIRVTVGLSGHSLSFTYESDPIIVNIGLGASVPIAGYYDASDGIVVTIGLSADIISENIRNNWVAWSKIGQMLFQQDLTNDSGFRMMMWQGWVYNILKLLTSQSSLKSTTVVAVVYGSGGISMLIPAESPAPTFGYKTVLQHGILCKDAVCGDEDKHFFIDRQFRLWTLTSKEGAKMLGYEEFLSTLTDPVMHYDAEESKVYISDDTSGFILTEMGLGKGYGHITAFQYDEGNIVVGSPTALAAPSPMLVVTDIIDFGVRGLKTIESVTIGAEVTNQLYVALDYRYDKQAAFATSHWVAVNKEGVAWLRMTASEFRIRIKNLVYDPIELDYLNIHYKVSDKRAIRGVIGGFQDDR